MLTSCDLILADRSSLAGAIFITAETLKYKEVIANKGMPQKYVRVGIQKLCQQRDQIIKSAISLFENLLVHEVHPKANPKQITIVQQYCKPDAEFMAGKNILSSKAMGYNKDVAKFATKVTQCSTYLKIHCTTAHMHVELSQEATRAWVSIAAMWLIELSEKMKYLN